MAVCVRVPYADHDAVRCCCRRFRDVAEREALARHREGSGWCENALIVAGGGNTVYETSDDAPEPDRPETWALLGGRWREMRRQPVPRCDCGVVAMGGEMVCAGGTLTTWDDEADGWKMTTGIGEVVGFSPRTNTWRSFGALGGLDARTSAACCVDPVTGDLVVVGGWRVVDRRQFYDNAVASNQSLDASTPGATWRRLPELLKPVSNFAVAVLGEKLYVAGGLHWDDDGRKRTPSDQLQIFDFRRGTWALGPRLPTSQYYGDGTAYDGKLYVVGGKNPQRKLCSKVAIFDPQTGTWAEGPSLPKPRFYHATLVHNNRLIVLGGQGLPLVLNANHTEWTYDPDVLPSLPAGFDHPLLAPMVCSVPIG